MKLNRHSPAARNASLLDIASRTKAGLIATALAAATLLGASAAHAAPPERSSDGPWAKGRLLVVAKPGLSSTELGKIVRGQGGAAKRIGKSQIYTIDLPPQASEKAVLARLKGNPHIESVELDQFVSVDAASNDPYAGSQWHLSKIQASFAWDVSQGAAVTIAIVDTGVQSDHPDLRDRMVAGYNFYDNNTNTADVHSHGTKVAGAAAATLNNGVGVASVAGRASIMPLRVADSSGYATFSNIAKAITYAADKGARVANVSLDASGSSTVASAAQYMKDRNGLVFIGAGNSGKDPGRAARTSFIVVSATDSNDNRTSWSNYGANVDLAAPGSGIYSTTWGSGYASVSGTSFSSPIAAAVGALVMAANPGLQSADVEQILFATALDIGTAGKDIYYGHGRVDAAAAVYGAQSQPTTPGDTEAPSATITSPGAGDTVSGLATVDVSATDNVGVSKVELWVNGALHATDTSAPYSFSWDTTKVASGSASLQAKAFDGAGNAASSPAFSVTVSNNAIADTTAPVARITNPAEGSKVSGTVKISASASDDSGVSGISMALYINGKLVASSSGSSSLNYSWNTRRVAVGTHTVSLSARDAAGNTATHSVKVTR